MSRTIIWALGLFMFVAATNRYGPAPEADAVPGDAFVYLRLAAAAPGLPAPEGFALHHLQRIALPYTVGMLGRAVPVPLHTVFQAAALLFALTILLVASRTLRRLHVGGAAAAAALALMALNPWALRFTLRFPEMLPDLGFVLGLSLQLHGLVTRQPAGVITGQVAASLSRQTGLALIPVVVLWLWRDKDWQNTAPSRRAALAGATAAAAAAIYGATAWLMADVAAIDENAIHIAGLWSWLRAGPDMAILAAFFLSATLAPLAAVALLVTPSRTPAVAEPKMVLLVLAFVCVAIQPVLGGPAVTGGNAPRLTALGLLPLCLAAGIALSRAGWPVGGRQWPLWGVVAALAAGSMHHWYVLSDSPTFSDRLTFAVASAVACATVIYTTWRFSRHAHGSTRQSTPG